MFHYLPNVLITLPTSLLTPYSKVFVTVMVSPSGGSPKDGENSSSSVVSLTFQELLRTWFGGFGTKGPLYGHCCVFTGA